MPLLTTKPMRDIDALTKRLRKKGWVLIRKTKHGILMRSPRGFVQLIPGTPGDSRSLRNLDGQIRRKNLE
jgi:hypothetical protein